MMDALVTARNVAKSYCQQTALDDISVEVPRAHITGLIGPDGAGKSSFMKIILGLTGADGGSLEFLPREGPAVSVCFDTAGGRTDQRAYVRRHVGYMSEVFSLYSDLSVEENLLFSFRIHKGSDYRSRAEWLYAFNRLEGFANTRAGALSGGMKQKLALSCALMHDPELLVLDEPTTGVDPLSRREFWSILKELKNMGVTIMVSTPYMEEALGCDRIVLMHKARVLESGTPFDLLDRFPGLLLEIPVREGAPQLLRRAVSDLFPHFPVYLSGRNVRVMLPGDGERERACSTLSKNISQSLKPVTVLPGLEDLFLVRVHEGGGQ
ncbi:MAG: ABC transporter ATP-binding protein [Spirochaetales bacterium]|nr:ABC transporter ATP-binding protein [Spirochaetales bacterium]